MLPLARNGYTEQEIKDALHGKKGTRKIRFRYDLLDKLENKIAELTNVQGGEVSFAAMNDIKRVAKFQIKDDGQINWLSDRIQPFLELEMPAVQRKHDNYALEFPGVLGKYVMTNQKVKVGNETTYRARFKVSSFNQWGAVMGNFSNSSPARGFNIIPYQGYIRVCSGNGLSGYVFNDVVSSDIQINKWVDVSVTYKDGIFKVYINGIEKGSFSRVLSHIEQYFLFGRWSLTYSDYMFNGVIDFAIVYEKSLTQSEVTEELKNYTTFKGVAHLWRFNEGSGSVAKDDVNGNDATISGATWQRNGVEIETVPSKYISFPLGIFLLSSPTRSDQTGGVIRSVEAYDGTVVLMDDKFDDIYTIVEGTNYKDAVITLLQSAGITKYIIEDTSKTLSVDIQFEIGTSKIKAINSLLAQINFTPIRVDVNGFYISGAYVSPSARSAEYTYKDDELSVTYKGMVEQLDLFSTANKWVVVRTNAEELPLKSVFVNENEESETSTVSRGRTIVDYRELDNIADQPALDAYTQRIAFEASQVFGKIEFNTAIMPMHDYYDILQIEYEGLDINDKYTEMGWSFPLSTGGVMKHSVRKVVNIE